MKISKFNIGLSLSRNFDKVVLEVTEENIEYNSDEELKAKIRKTFSLIKEEVELQFKKIRESNDVK